MRSLLNASIVALFLVLLLAGSGAPAAADELDINITSAADSESQLGVDPPADVATIFDSPYNSVTITVAITGDDGPSNAREQVQNALSYWENNSKQYVNYPVEYKIVDSNPDVRVDLTNNVSSCGLHTGDYYGCADLVTDDAPSTVSVEIETTLTKQGVYETAVHEFGHTLGVEHGDEPTYYMQATSPNPWERPTTTIYFGDVKPTDDVLAGLEYLAAETAGVNGSFETVESQATADIVVVKESDACGEYASCSSWGEDYNDQMVITMETTLANDVAPWHVARLVASAAGEIPPPLELDATYRERSSEWWTE